MQINTMQPQSALFQGQQQDLNSIWDNTMAHTSQNAMQQQQQPSGQMFGAQPWMNPGMMGGGMMFQNRIYEPSPQLLQQTKNIQEEVKEKIKEETKVSDVTKNMVDVLSTSTNPKHRNSKFLKFLNKLNYGAYTLENDQLQKHPEKIEQFREIETQRRNDDLLQQIQSQSQPETSVEEVYRDILKDDPEITGEQFEDMMKEWMQTGSEMQNMEQMMADWGKQWDQGMQLQMPQQQPLIAFQPDNPYLESSQMDLADKIDNLQRAKQLIEQSRVQEAILCLEAEVQTNSQNSEAWRLMGQLYQENDQDDYAIISFKMAHEIDPYDLDSLMMLGVSCTNELVEKDAKNYLHEWLKYHPDFQGMTGIQETPELDFIQLKQAFDAAHILKPADTQVLMALGILNFIQRDYMSAGQCFITAIKENPTDHTLWNKYGACMSNNMNIPQAIQAYEQALDLRPNYVRTIVNLGLAKNRVNDHKAAAGCFLNALMLNPNVSQAWTYLRQSFMKMSRFDLLEKLEARDPMIFKDEFLLIDPSNLQAPSLDRLWTQDILNN